MNKALEFKDMIARRSDQILVRLVLAVCIGLCAYLLRASPWPMLWLGAVAVSQLFENLCIDKPLQREGARITRAGEIFITVLSGVNAAIYVSLSAYTWSCGAAGQLFATMLICGSLLHVCLHLYTVRWVQISGGIAPTALLFGLPVYDQLHRAPTNFAAPVVMVVAGSLYLAHLLAGVANNREVNTSMRKAMMEAEEQRRRAEEESQSKSTFLATISHEIRTPLNAVTSAANLLKETDLTPRQEEYVSILLNGGEVLLGLINQVLDMSKIEAGKMTLDIADVEVKDLAQKLSSLWIAPAQARGLYLAVEVDPALPPVIRADGLRLSQVLFNLVSNAVKFTEKGGVRIRIGLDEAAADGRRLIFQVSDTGPGIRPEDQDRLFLSFEQAEAGTTRRFGGTGLGLAIAKNLAGLMGGELTLDSRVGEGARFSLRLPLTAADAPAPAPAAPLSAALDETTPLRLLLAEDHEVNRRLLSFLLEPLGVSLVVAVDGQEAVQAAARECFDVILMDYQMPVLSGLDATKAIRKGRGVNAATPIIALTANAFQEQRAEWLAAGADAFLTKPVDPALLVSTLIALTAPQGDPAADTPLETALP